MALIAGLGLIGLLAWAFAGGGGKPPTQPEGNSRTYHPVPAAAASRSAASHSAASHSAASGSAASRGSTASGPAVASSGSARPLAPGLPSPSAHPAASPGGSASAGLVPGQLNSDGLCAPGTVVLSLFTTKPSYPGGQDPRFAVYAVSTAAGVCTFDIGPGKLHLEVMSSGRVIWDSGDCARSDSTWIARLRRGVPVLESITWNRTITLPGCVTLASSARAGAYQAQAWTASASSAVLTFRLLH
jgi:hypothetical protein